MSKELVDRELLEQCVELLDLLPESRTVVSMRELLAQPAEAEGVDVVAWRCEASKPGIKTQVRLVFTWPEAESFALHYGGIGCKVTTTALVEKAKHLAAVTAELTAAGIAYRIRGDVIAELTAERDRLRALIAECAEYLNTDRETTIGSGSILHRQMIAAMAAKEAESLPACSGCGVKGWTGNCDQCIPY